MKNIQLLFLGIIASFVFCSHRLDALRIKNGLKKEITIKYITDKYIPDEPITGKEKLRPFYFVDIPSPTGIVVLPGKTIEIRNQITSRYESETSEAFFNNLIIGVEYEGKKHKFDTGPLPKEVSDDLVNKKQGIIFKLPTNEVKMRKYYFNPTGKLNELNIRFYLSVVLHK